MKKRYMSYLWEPKKIPRTSAFRHRLAGHCEQVDGISTPPVTLSYPELQTPLENNAPVISTEAVTSPVSATVEGIPTSESSFSLNCALEDIVPDVSPECLTFVDEIHQAPLPNNNLFEDEERHPSFEDTLCSCTSATAGDVYLMTLAIGLRHNLPWSAQVDILKMVNSLFGADVVQATKHHYLQYVKSDNIETETHYYCPGCQVPVKAEAFEPNGSSKCDCDETFLKDTAPYFMTLNLEKQFTNLLKEPSVEKSLLSHRFHLNKVNSDGIEDVYDGLVYQRHFMDNGILSNPYNFSYNFNSDGVKSGVSCSKNKTMWPIFITVNELPYLERKRHVLLAGLYVGRHHPNMNTFLEPFVTQCNKLSEAGITWTNSCGEVVNSKAIPLCAIVDSPARCSMLQMNSFNSTYGCTFCYQMTQHTAKGRRFSGRLIADLRTHESTLLDMQIAFKKQNEKNKSKRRHKGVWRPSVLMTLKYFDLMKGFVPDYMHALLLGAVRQHTQILLDPQRKAKFWKMDEDLGIEHLISLIDSYLDKITPPHCITRLPRSLSDRDIWKASEWRSWLLFYAFVCLKDELKEQYLLHLSMLSVAANILLQKSITAQDLTLAEELIVKYVFLYEEYFGPMEMNYCIHLLLHLVEGVRNMGPLWTHNAFVYEGENRFLLQLLTSSKKVALQLSTKYLTYASLGTLCKKFTSNETTVQFCEILTGKHLKFYHRSDKGVLFGNGLLFVPNCEEKHCLDMNGLAGKSTSFQKCILKHVRLSTSSYSAGKKNNDSVVFTTDGKFLSIVNFLVFDDDSPVILAREIVVCQNSILSDDDVQVNHIFKIKESCTSSLVVIQPDSIQCLCIIMNLPHGCFVSKIPFGCLGD